MLGMCCWYARRAAIKVTRPDEIAQYVKLFELLQAEAIYGQDARQLIRDVIAGL